MNTQANTTSQETTTCPECDGYGAFTHNYSTTTHRSTPGSRSCSRCQGTGKLTTAAPKNTLNKAEITSQHGDTLWFKGSYTYTSLDSLPSGCAPGCTPHYVLEYSGRIFLGERKVWVGFGDYRCAEFGLFGGTVGAMDTGSNYGSPTNGEPVGEFSHHGNYDALRALPPGVLWDVLALFAPDTTKVWF